MVVKYSNSGDLIWKQLIDISEESKDHLTGIYIDEDNNIVVIGYSKWNDDEAKSIIIKLSSEGEILWDSFYSDDYDWSFAQSLAVDTNGDIYMTGYNVENGGLREMYVCKFDSEGEFIWDDIYSVDNSGRYQGVAVKIIDDLIISLGYFYSPFPLDKRVVILNHVKSGELLESNEASFEGSFHTYYIDDQGNSYIGLFGDFKIIKYDQSGNEQWAFEVPTNLPSNVMADEVQDIISDNVGNVYITGRHYGENYGDVLNQYSVKFLKIDTIDNQPVIKMYSSIIIFLRVWGSRKALQTLN